MKSSLFVVLLTGLSLISCQKEMALMKKSGVKLTLEASIQTTKTSYLYDDASKGIFVAWEASEGISVVSIGDTGITAVDEFTSTGDAGREIAQFTGTWTGNDGDTVICLYPSISTTAGNILYSGVTVGSSEIMLNRLDGVGVSPQNISTLKNADVLVGDVTIFDSNAYVKLSREIEVLRVVIDPSGLASGGGDNENIRAISIGVKSGDENVVIATKCSMPATKSTYTGSFTATEFGALKYSAIFSQRSGLQTLFVPIFASGNLESGQVLEFAFDARVRYGYGNYENVTGFRITNKALSETAPLEKGKVYNISFSI